jgi:uncharacterized protein
MCKLEPAMAVGTETGRRVARLGSVYKRHPYLAFYSLTLAISWSFWIPVAVSHQALIPLWPSTLFLIFGAFGPSLAAIVLTAMDGGRNAIRGLFSGLLKWRVDVRWYLVVLLLPAVFCLSAVALHVLLGGAAPRLYSPVPWYLLPAYFLHVLLFVGPMTEEIGWRWYALPMLQAERSALLASLVLGSSWALWHLPLAWTGETSWPGLPFPLFALAIVALAILFTWAYNGTGGSLLIVLLFHAAINFTLTLVPVQPTSTMPLRTCLIGVGLLLAATIVVVIAEGPTRLTRKPPP